jgi:hypothetical protein
MTKNSDPFVYFTRENGKLALCMSYIGKWVAGIVATLFTTGFAATFALVWAGATNSAEALTEIRNLKAQVERLDEDMNRYDDRLRDLEKGEKA